MKKEKTLDEYVKIAIETDETNPIIIAEITSDNIDVIKGYRVRIIPKNN